MTNETTRPDKSDYTPSNVTPEHYSYTDYIQDFQTHPAIREGAFKQAHDIRKFEIDLYWKRASYFWAFIAAALAGYALIESKEFESQEILSLLLSCTGFIFALGWFFVNRGSKFWQENWENHVDNLEDSIVGPLYKVVLSRPKPDSIPKWFKHGITGPSTFSVSKINQIISLYVTCLWAILITNSLLPIHPSLNFDPIKGAILALTASTVITFIIYGRSYFEPMRQTIRKRDVDFDDRTNQVTPSL